jgi:hypothetical protein
MGTCKTSQVVTAARSRIVWAVVAWALALGLGLIAMARYESTPGAAATAPRTWPISSSLIRPDDQPTLVMFVHPRCPCTRASIAQLTEVMASAHQPAAVHVVFCTPPHAESSWYESDSLADVAAIPGITVIRDEGGVEAHRFGASTSGQVLVFNQAGSLAFEGGITAGRGHVGDSLGSSAVATILSRRQPAVRQTPVFGCDLFASTKCPLCVDKEAP